MVCKDALDAIECLSELEYLDNEPSTKELYEALDYLALGKANGRDGIPAELLNWCREAILTELHKILCRYWKESEVLQDTRDANMVTLYKNKGDIGDCSNYRGISLLSTLEKLFARVVLKRLQVLAERVYPESQYGFRKGRSIIDMIFSLRQAYEKCGERRQALFVAFIDVTKAFDFVSRDGLFKILPKTGCPPKLLSITKSFHSNLKGQLCLTAQHLTHSAFAAA